MTFNYDASTPPPPMGLYVLGRHGDKFKVRIGRLTKIVTREQVLVWAEQRRRVGGPVSLNGYIQEN